MTGQFTSMNNLDENCPFSCRQAYGYTKGDHLKALRIILTEGTQSTTRGIHRTQIISETLSDHNRAAHRMDAHATGRDVPPLVLWPTKRTALR